MKVLCCGGRNFNDYGFVCAHLDALRKTLGEFAVIHGGAKGADAMCGLWAARNGLPVIVVEANWHSYGKAAGSLRNQWMLHFCEPGYVVAFPGGSGTRNMIQQSKDKGLTVWEPAA